MMSNSVFLVDTNALITPYQQYYPFDFAKSFWDQIRNCIESGKIVILDMVKLELQNGDENDPLKRWIEETEIQLFVDHREPSIWNNMQMFSNTFRIVVSITTQR